MRVVTANVKPKRHYIDSLWTHLLFNKSYTTSCTCTTCCGFLVQRVVQEMHITNWSKWS